MMLLDKHFWMDAVERMVKTVCEVALALIGTGMVGIMDVDWLNLLSVCVMAALVSVLSSIASSIKTDTVSGASLVSNPATTANLVDPLPEDEQPTLDEVAEKLAS